MGLVWLSVGLISLSAFLWCVYVVWMAVTLRFHYKMWQDWQLHNQMIHLRNHHAHGHGETIQNEENRPNRILGNIEQCA